MNTIIARKIQAITFATHDPEALSEFYQRAFGFPAARWEGKDHLGLQMENIYLGFDRMKEKHKPGTGGAVVWFYVENVEAAFYQLLAAGAKVRTEINKDERPGQAMAVFYDPDENLIGLIGPSVPGGGK